MSSPKMPISRVDAKERARALQASAKAARKPLTYTQALAQVAREAGYANIHEMTAQYSPDLPLLADILSSKEVSEALVRIVTRGTHSIVIVRIFPGSGFSASVRTKCEGSVFECQASMLSQDDFRCLPYVASDGSIQSVPPRRVVPENTKVLILDEFSQRIDPAVLTALREDIGKGLILGSPMSSDMSIIVTCHSDEDIEFAVDFFSDKDVQAEGTGGGASREPVPGRPSFDLPGPDNGSSDAMLQSLDDWGGLDAEIMRYLHQYPTRCIGDTGAGVFDSRAMTPREWRHASHWISRPDVLKQAADYGVLPEAGITAFIDWLSEQRR